MSALLLLLLQTAPLQSADPRAKVDGAGPCVIVDVAGKRAGALTCANRRLDAAVRLERARAMAAPRLKLPASVQNAPTAIGVATPAAARLRLGRNYGTSTRPFRPTLPTNSGVQRKP